MSIKLVRNIVVFLFIFFNVQCSDKNKKTIIFDDNRWQKSEKVNFTFNNPTEDNLKSLDVSLSYVYGSQFSEIPLEIQITSPLNKVEKFPLVIKIFDKEKNELGNCMGDYCDIKKNILEDYNFTEIGDYEINVLNKFNNNYLPNIFSVGVEVY